MSDQVIGRRLNPKQGQTWLQAGIICVGSAVLFQLAAVFATANIGEILQDPQRWLISAGIGVINVAGVSLLALKTSGGLKF